MYELIIDPSFVHTPRIKLLARDLDIPVAQAIGHVLCLFSAVIQDMAFHSDDCVCPFNDDEFTVACGWDGDKDITESLLERNIISQTDSPAGKYRLIFDGSIRVQEENR